MIIAAPSEITARKQAALYTKDDIWISCWDNYTQECKFVGEYRIVEVAERSCDNEDESTERVDQKCPPHPRHQPVKHFSDVLAWYRNTEKPKVDHYDRTNDDAYSDDVKCLNDWRESGDSAEQVLH